MPTMNPEEQTPSEKERIHARKMFMEKVSIPGLVDLHQAQDICTQGLWYIAYLASIVSVFYHTTLLIQQHLDQQPTYEHLQTNKKPIPFPKVTICAPTGINKTWVMERIDFPEKEKKIFDRMSAKEQTDFIDTLIGLVNIGGEASAEISFTHTDPRYFMYLHVIEYIEKNMLKERFQLAYYNGALPSCEQTVSNCRLGDQPYECCHKASVETDTLGVCYDLKINQIHESIYQHQSIFKPLTFSFDLTMDRTHILPDLSMNGFFVHMTEAAVGVAGRPITVPAGMHVSIVMSQPTWRIDKSNCISHHMPDTPWGPYDSDGFNCCGEKYMDMLTKTLGCEHAFGPYIPSDDTSWCSGAMLVPVKLVYAYGVADNNNPNTIKTELKARQDILDLQKKSGCLPLCEAWQFQPHHSYSELIDTDHTTPDGGDASNNISRSRVSVILASDYYIEKSENDLKPFYDTFVLIAFVIGLYMGCSMISLMEIGFYGINVGHVYRKTSQKKNAIGIA